MMRSSNPALRPSVFTNSSVMGLSRSSDNVMTVQGTVNKTGIMLLILFATAAWSWAKVRGIVEQGGSFPSWLLWLPLLGGLGVAFLTIFKPHLAKITAPVYAGLEGLLLGAISMMMEMQFPGIVSQAVLGTFCVFGMMLFIYKTGIIKVTNKFRTIVVAATGGIALVYMISIALNFFGAGIPYIFGSGPIGIGFSLFVIVFAALNLLMDFDLIEDAARTGAPKFMEWYGAFALIVTLIWLYLEILRLLAKLQGRNR